MQNEFVYEIIEDISFYNQLYEDIKLNIPSFKPLDTYRFEGFEIKIYSSYMKILRPEVKAK